MVRTKRRFPLNGGSGAYEGKRDGNLGCVFKKAANSGVFRREGEFFWVGIAKVF